MRAATVAGLASWGVLASLAAQPAEAQQSAYQRVAGCYAVEATPAAPWLGEVERRMRLTLQPIASEPGSSAQFAVEHVSGGGQVIYPYVAWSLFADGQLVSVTWTSETDQVGLVFEARPRAARVAIVGTTTFFTHDTGMTTSPVDVLVTPVEC